MSNGMKTLKVPEQVWQQIKVNSAKLKMPMYEYVADAVKCLEAKKRSVEST